MEKWYHASYQFCWHSPLELMLVLKGKAEIFADGKKYLLEQDDLLLINSNCGHSIFLRELDSLVLVCEVPADFFREKLAAELSTLQIDCVSSSANKEDALFSRLRFFLVQSFFNALIETPAVQRAGSFPCTVQPDLPFHALQKEHRHSVQRLYYSRPPPPRTGGPWGAGPFHRGHCSGLRLYRRQGVFLQHEEILWADAPGIPAGPAAESGAPRHAGSGQVPSPTAAGGGRGPGAIQPQL